MENMIKALIFDLDNCLASPQEVGNELYDPVIDAIREANRGAVPEEVLNEAIAESWRHPLDWVAARYGFSEAMLAAGSAALAAAEVTRPMSGYGDLASLSELPAQLFLVTSGFRRLQESKIRALQLEPIFTSVYVDAIGEPERLGKLGLFERILKESGLAPSEVLVVGDNPDSEIEAGNRLGMRTVQTLRPGVPRADNATFHIQSLAELLDIVGRLSTNADSPQ